MLSTNEGEYLMIKQYLKTADAKGDSNSRMIGSYIN
jgi:hypothetical protein